MALRDLWLWRVFRETLLYHRKNNNVCCYMAELVLRYHIHLIKVLVLTWKIKLSESCHTCCKYDWTKWHIARISISCVLLILTTAIHKYTFSFCKWFDPNLDNSRCCPLRKLELITDITDISSETAGLRQPLCVHLHLCYIFTGGFSLSRP